MRGRNMFLAATPIFCLLGAADAFGMIGRGPSAATTMTTTTTTTTTTMMMMRDMAKFASSFPLRRGTLMHTSLHAEKDGNEKAPADATEAEAETEEETVEDHHSDHSGEEWQLPDEESTDILNSPAFLRRKVDVLKSDLDKIEFEIDEANAALESNKAEWGSKMDDLQREYLNIQDRMSRQSREGAGIATIEVVRKMLEVMDNYDRAFGQVEAVTDEEKEIEAAYARTREMILEIFEKLDVKEVETVGTEFDYEVHQAVMQRPSEYEENIVCEELAKGYILGDKLIRAAMVSVSAGTY